MVDVSKRGVVDGGGGGGDQKALLAPYGLSGYGKCGVISPAPKVVSLARSVGGASPGAGVRRAFDVISRKKHPRFDGERGSLARPPQH